jgi:hypothetical protein
MGEYRLETKANHLWQRLQTHINWQNMMRTMGAAGFTHELLLGSGPERPFLLSLCGVLMGLPFFINADLKNRGEREG